MFDTNTLSGEILLFSGILLSVFLIGVLGAVTKIRSEKSVSKWAFQPSVAHQATKVMVGTPIDLMKQEQVVVQPVMMETTSTVFETSEPVIEEVVFETSNIDDNDELLSSIDSILSEMNGNNVELELQRTKEQAAFLVGDTVAEFITAPLDNLPKEKAIIFGRFIEATNEIEMNNIKLSLSTTEQLNLADGDLMLIKGQHLPNNEFRVLHWDDADNVEAGYGHEDFVIQLVS